MNPGDLYQYFRGSIYEIVTLAHDSESPDELVVYRLRLTEMINGRLLIRSDEELIGASGIPSPRDRTWAMSITTFTEIVERNGYSGLVRVPRFRPVKLKPIDVCRRFTAPRTHCGYTEKEHGELDCLGFIPEQEVVEP